MKTYRRMLVALCATCALWMTACADLAEDARAEDENALIEESSAALTTGRVTAKPGAPGKAGWNGFAATLAISGRKATLLFGRQPPSGPSRVSNISVTVTCQIGRARQIVTKHFPDSGFTFSSLPMDVTCPVGDPILASASFTF